MPEDSITPDVVTTDIVDSTQNTGTELNQETANNSDNLPEQSTETSQPAQTQDTPATQFDDDLDDWIAKRKAPIPQSDDERQAYQDLRNEQRAFTRQRQSEKAAEQARQMQDLTQGYEEEAPVDNILEARLNDLERRYAEERTTRLQSEFYITNNVTDEEHQTLLSILSEKLETPTTPEARDIAFRYWTDPSALQDLLDLSRARLMQNTDTSAIEDAAARTERERIARESQATPQQRGAKSFTGGTTPEQERLARFSQWD